MAPLGLGLNCSQCCAVQMSQFAPSDLSMEMKRKDRGIRIRESLLVETKMC